MARRYSAGLAAGLGKRAFEVLLLLRPRVASAPTAIAHDQQRGCQPPSWLLFARMLSAISAARARAVCM